MVDRLVNSEANARRIALVESCFGNSGQPLAVPGRVLVGEGVLTKMCRKKPKPRQFYLFNDILVYGNIIINKKKYNKQHIIPLEEVKLQNVDDDIQNRNGWLICTRGKSFAVYAATANEKQEWMAHINKCIKDLIEKSGKKPAYEHAAVWVPDSEAAVCMVCTKSQFNVLNRRHHCRKCGAVVCGACSTKRFLLPSQSSKPIRVCDPCFEQLSDQASGTKTDQLSSVSIEDSEHTVEMQEAKRRDSFTNLSTVIEETEEDLESKSIFSRTSDTSQALPVGEEEIPAMLIPQKNPKAWMSIIHKDL